MLLVNGQPAFPQPPASEKAPSSKPIPATIFQDWPANRKPDVVFVLSGQQHSYLKFCGCTEPQLGGFERRYNFVQKLRERGWPVIGLDLGDLVWHQSGTIHEQSILKYEAAIKSLAAIGYAALAVGEYDFKLPLTDGLSNTVLQKPRAFPRLLCANLADRAVNFPVDLDKPNDSLIGTAVITGGQNGVPKIGITAVAGPAVMMQAAMLNHRFDEITTPSGKQMSERPAIESALKEMAAAGVEFRVLLYQGTVEQAMGLAGAPNAPNAGGLTFPDKFDLILCQSAEEAPPMRVETVGRTTIVRVGHRGRYIGVLGVFRNGQTPNPFDKHFQIVEMSDDYETDPDREADHPILKILEDYAKEVRAGGFVKKIPQTVHPVQAQFPNQKVVFVGSDRCKACHAKECALWEADIPGSAKKHSHAKAFQALEKYAKKPRLRQFDPECVVCHTIGYGFTSGYRGEAEARLKNVGCENCHGPGSLHVANPTDTSFHLALSPWKANKNDLLPSPERLQLGFNALNQQEQRILKNVNDLCQKCHDTDNDPHFRFEAFWPRILHGRDRNPVIPAAHKTK
jgi:hypothetical protein